MLGRDRSLVGFALVVALFVASCGGADATTLATVNGAEITMEDMRQLRPLYQEDEINTNTEQFRTDLTALIFTVALENAAEELLAEAITEAEIDARLANPPDRYVQNFAQIAAAPDLTDEVLRREALVSLIRDRVSAELMRREDGYLERIIDDAPELVTSGCIRHILVDTEAEALAALDRLEAGEDFAALADELSTDTVSQGGLLADGSGCVLPMSRWVPEFANAAAGAPVGETIGPVQTDFGFHLILVEEKVAPTREEFLTDPIDYVDGSTVSSFFTPWFNDEVRAADISVNILVGRWSVEGIGIAPPDA